MKIDRRAFTRAVSAATAAVLTPGRALAQTVPLKALVAKGWLIGAARNQNQSDGGDTAGVALVTRQFNSSTPENLLRSRSVEPQAGQFTFDAQGRHVAVGIDRNMVVITRVRFWRVSDGDSWLNRGRVNHPLLRDRQRRPKRAFDRVASVLANSKH
jgi:GH35 family endo-1,4-beta-xylanase